MKIPVFHDDQHGTAIISSAALINALMLVDKKIEDIRIVSTAPAHRPTPAPSWRSPWV
jgi:malic enzyme